MSMNVSTHSMPMPAPSMGAEAVAAAAAAAAAEAQVANLPHSITVVGTDCQMHIMPCNLATLTVREVYHFCAAQFGCSPDSFDLLHSTNVLPNDEQTKAIDIGLGNGMYVIMQHKGAFPMSGFDMMGPCPHPAAHLSPSPPMLPSPMGMLSSSPPLQPLSPLLDGSLDMQYDLALVQNAHSQMQLVAALSGMNVSPTSSPPAPPALPMPVSPPMLHQQPRIPRPTGALNLNSMGDICSYAMTNEGSRALVHAIEEQAADNKAIAAKIAEMSMKFGVVASHQHGSKVVRALLRVATPEQVTILIRTACDFMCELCESNTGSDVFVEIIQASTDPADAETLVGRIVAWGPRSCTIINGRKIIQAVLTKFDDTFVEPIFDMIGQNLLHLATDQTGCVTIQRCLDHASNPTLKMVLQMQIMEATSYLIQDMYGNYVLQHAIKGDAASNCSKVLASKFKGSVAQLAVNKYASCVIEKCLAMSTDEVREQIIAEVIVDIRKLMWDGFGNFVVQSAVDYAPASMVDALREVITPYINDCPYGYRIEGKLNKRIKKAGRKPITKTTSERSLSPQEREALMQIMSASSPAPALNLTRVAVPHAACPAVPAVAQAP